MVEGALYPIPTLNGTLSGGVRTVIVSPEGEAFLTEPQKESLRSLILMPGDTLPITYDLRGGITIDNDENSVEYGGSYIATIATTHPEYFLHTVVLMGGSNVTDVFVTKPSFNTAEINIPNVTSNLTISTSTELYIKHINTIKFNKTDAQQAGIDKVYDDMHVIDILPFINVTLYGSLSDGTTDRNIVTTDFTVDGDDLTLPDDGKASGIVTLPLYWNPKPSIKKNFSIAVYRRTT